MTRSVLSYLGCLVLHSLTARNSAGSGKIRHKQTQRGWLYYNSSTAGEGNTCGRAYTTR